MIDIRKLKELVRLMVENDLSELDLQDQQETVTIKRGSAGAVLGTPVVQHVPVAAAGAPVAASASDDRDTDAPAPAPRQAAASSGGDTSGLLPIASPMVGTVYLAPNPDASAFVQVGASVGPDTTVCLIEAMKVFSEIKAETAGTIERILVTNGQSVEYGQPLFLVRPN